MKAVVIYTTDGGNTLAYCTEAVAHLKTLGVEVALKHVEQAKVDDLKAVDFFILAEPTWGDGEHYDNWIPFDEAMQKADLKGSKGAVIAGCDRSYAQFGVAIDLIEDTMKKAGAAILQRGLKIELEPTAKLYEYLKGTWLTNLVKRAKGEMPVEANTPRMTLKEVCEIMGKPIPAEGEGDAPVADAANAAMPPKKAVSKVLPPPLDPIAPARQFEKKFSKLDTGRRLFAQIATYSSLGGVTALVHAFFFPGLLYDGVLFEPPREFKIGTADDFALGVDTKYLASSNIWVVKEPNKLYVVLAICTHLGCTPDWKDNEKKYKCPCHGSGYYMDGTNFEGPAPRPMEHCKVSIDAADGNIVVDKSTVFRGELNQWNNSGAYIPL